MSCKIAIGVPSSGMCQAFFAQSLANLINVTKGTNLNDIEDIQFTLLLQIGSSIHSNRQSLAEKAIELNADYLLFIDDDMAFHPDALLSLLSRRQAVVGANYPQRAFPIKFTGLHEDGVTYLPTTEQSGGLEQVGFLGFGFCLIHTSVFQDLPKPWFMPKYVPEKNIFTTEDYPFFEKIRQHGYLVFMDHDASKLIGHVGSHLFRWNQADQKDTNAP